MNAPETRGKDVFHSSGQVHDTCTTAQVDDRDEVSPAYARTKTSTTASGGVYVPCI